MNKPLSASELSAYWMPYTANRNFKASPRMLVSAEGMYYRDDAGNAILDGTAGLWCVPLGHAQPKIVSAVQKAVATLDYASSVPGAWIVGVGFDLLPLVMLAILMLAFAEAREPYQPRKPFTVVGGREAA